MKRTITTMCFLMACVAMMGQVEKEFAVSNFSTIKFCTAGKVIYKIGKKPSVHVVGVKETVDKIEVNVSDGVLTISQKKDEKKRKGNNTSPVYTITAPSLSELNVLGVCTFEAYSVKTDGTFKLGGGGVANVSIDLLECSNVNIRFTGVANVKKLNVRCKQADIKIPGVMNGKMAIDATQLNILSNGVDHSTISFKGERCIANYTGTSTSKLNVDCKSLQATSSGVAKLTVAGTADKTEITSNGVSKIVTKELNAY